MSTDAPTFGLPTGDFPDPAGMVWSDAFGWHRYDPAPPWFRDDGTQAQRGDWWWVENGQLHFGPPQFAELPRAERVPNRLLGATILENGDAA